MDVNTLAEAAGEPREVERAARIAEARSAELAASSGLQHRPASSPMPSETGDAAIPAKRRRVK